MNAMDQNLSTEVLRWQEKLFQRSVRRQARLRKVKQLLGITSNQTCLEVTSGDGIISQQLRLDGGTWTTLVTTHDAQAALAYFIKPEVQVLDGNTINAPDHSFDAVVIVDALERIRDDHAFIKECHRVLKTDGRLIVTAARKMPFALGGGPLRALLGQSWKRRGLERAGYTAHEFFNVLKDGFDVPETASYSSCCVEVPGLMCEAAANKMAGGPYNMPPANADTEHFYHYTRLCAFGTLLWPLMWLLSKIEKVLIFIVPGHNMVAKTKRRVWRERRTPILLDGRSIAEAALNTKIGTAAPF
ncbi:MAG: methyltransferase domain-containing protein [Kiritimatiellales bacterium]|nr:methyltransferase domain-containing protein [Kiritimatiellales bacterium]